MHHNIYFRNGAVPPISPLPLCVSLYKFTISQTLGPTKLKFSGSGGSSPEEVYGKFGEDRSKTSPIGLLFVFVFFWFFLNILGGEGSFPA